MITAIHGPLIVQPEIWTLVFNRTAARRWASWLALGRYKHVRAYAYVPFLHVWVFFDPHLSGTDIIVAADGEPAHALIGAWIADADLIRMQARKGRGLLPTFGFCTSTIKRLIGLRCVALRPDAFYRDCLRSGGVPFEAAHGNPEIQRACA